MSEQVREDRTSRRILGIGLGVSLVVILAVIAFGSSGARDAADDAAGRTVVLAELLPDPDLSQPLEVTEQSPSIVATSDGESASGGAAFVPIPKVAALNATLAAAIPDAREFLDVVENQDDESVQNVAAAYSNVEDVQPAGNGKTIRPVDGRSVAVLSGVGRRPGVGVGGGHCPAPRPGAWYRMQETQRANPELGGVRSSGF